MVDQLQQLIAQYILGAISHSEFRQKFIGEFAAASDDASAASLYDWVESGFSALAHGHVSELGFRVHLAQKAAPSNMHRVVDKDVHVLINNANLAQIVSFVSGNSIGPIPRPYSSRNRFTKEPELVEA